MLTVERRSFPSIQGASDAVEAALCQPQRPYRNEGSDVPFVGERIMDCTRCDYFHDVGGSLSSLHRLAAIALTISGTLPLPSHPCFDRHC